MGPIEHRCIVKIIKARYELLMYEDYYRSARGRMRPTRGRRIGVIAENAITRQIGRMRSTVRPTRGRRIAADYEWHNAFLAFITNAADARPTHDASAATCGRRPGRL